MWMFHNILSSGVPKYIDLFYPLWKYFLDSHTVCGFPTTLQTIAIVDKWNGRKKNDNSVIRYGTVTAFSTLAIVFLQIIWLCLHQAIGYICCMGWRRTKHEKEQRFKFTALSVLVSRLLCLQQCQLFIFGVFLKPQFLGHVTHCKKKFLIWGEKA